MKKAVFLLAGSCIPFVFLALYGDARFGTPGFWIGYGFMVLGFAILCKLTLRLGTRRILLLANVLSCVSSLIFTRLFQTEKWLWYFKPFSAEQLVLLLSFLSAAVQLLFLRFAPKGPSSPR